LVARLAPWWVTPTPGKSLPSPMSSPRPREGKGFCREQKLFATLDPKPHGWTPISQRHQPTANCFTRHGGFIPELPPPLLKPSAPPWRKPWRPMACYRGGSPPIPPGPKNKLRTVTRSSAFACSQAPRQVSGKSDRSLPGHRTGTRRAISPNVLFVSATRRTGIAPPAEWLLPPLSQKR